MNRKIKLLIIASILGLIALSLIQGYLIKNTFQLKKDVFLTETRKEIGRLDNYSPAIDSIEDKWHEYFLELLIKYHQNEFNNPKLINTTNPDLLNNKTVFKKELIKKLLKKADSLNEDYTRLYHNEMKQLGYKNNVKIQRRVNKIIMSDSIYKDTIFSDAYSDKFYLIGDKFNYKTGHRLSNALWLTDHDYEHKQDDKTIKKQNFYLEFETTDYMNIDDWKKIVLKRMYGIFSIALLLFLFVFGLLYYSIKNLIKQKKIADVKTDFVNNITHELKTPLATLTLATKMLSVDSVKKNETVLDQTVQTIERQNKRLQKLIDQVLDNSLGYKEIKLKKEEVNINDYLNTVIDDFLLSVGNRNIEIKKDFSKSNIQHSKFKIFKIDKFYFTTAILNLLENAVKYNGDEIKIEINSQINNTFILSIKDNGIGISKKNQKDLFEKFYRVDNKNVHNVKGLGLGLYYTNQIIKAHSGEIKVISEEQKGTEFVIEIPFS
jgi:signal transduction histidine kinase